MRFARTLVYSISLFLLIQSSCKSPTEATVFQDSHLVGRVVRSDDNSGIPGAVVRDLTFINVADTTNSSGDFDLLYSLDTKLNTRITAISTGFIDNINDTISVSLDPGQTVTGKGIVLGVDSSSPPSGSAYTGIAASIVQVATGPSNIAIRGTGANETTVLTWEVRDSLGFPVTLTKKVTVRFSILGGPGGGEYLLPLSVDSDSKGRVTTRVKSGATAGVIQVYATTRGDTVQSGPTKITITSGLPDAAHFSLSREKANIAGLLFDNLSANFSVIVGDRFGNPSQPVAVYFTTTGGIISTPALTGSDGLATAALKSGNPRPAGGRVIVTARTIGDSGTTISASIPIIFSGATRILGPTAQFSIQDSSEYGFSYQVQDLNGNPLVAGSTVKVTLSAPSGLELQGKVDYTFTDTDDTSATNFSAKVVDKTKGGVDGPVLITIGVTSPNGNATHQWFGYSYGSGGGGGGGGGFGARPYSIELVGITKTQLSVNEGGGGATTSSSLTFVVKDSLGNPVVNPLNPSSAKAYVTFSIAPSGGVGGGESLTPLADSTNNLGNVSTVFRSGTKSGIVSVIATTVVSGRPPITSRPDDALIVISGGSPDSSHFSAFLSKKNLPGLVNTGPIGNVTVQAGDKFGNPVKVGTGLYFSTTGGVIQASTATDNLGQATAALQGGLPVPNTPALGGAGFGYVTIYTVGINSTSLTKQLPFLFSGQPIVTLLNVPNDTLVIKDGDFFDLDYKIADANGNPIAGGNSIAVSVSGVPAGDISFQGDRSFTTSDTQDKILGTRFKIRVIDNVLNGGQSGDLVFSINVAGISGNVTRTFFGILRPPGGTNNPPPPSARLPAQIVPFGDPTAKEIFVTGVGGIENSVITYQVLDSLGQPIDKNNRVYATFEPKFFGNSLVGGLPPRVIPNADSSDDQGKLRASIVSGTQAGVVQLVAKIVLPGGRVLISQPVKVSIHAGFPDKGHFTLTLKPALLGAPLGHYVFPGFDLTNDIGFTAAVGDTFSNPVAAGTSVYFHSQAGNLTTGVATDANGFASNTLYTVNPTPDAAGTSRAGRPTFDATYGPGYHWLYAQTKGNFDVNIIDSVLLVWNRGPIRLVGIPDSISMSSHGISAPISFTVKDGNNNPLSDGTIISASIAFPTSVADVNFDVSGDFSLASPVVIPNAGYIRFPGAYATGSGVTDYIIRVVDLSLANTVGLRITVTIKVVSGIGTTQKTMVVKLL